MFEQLYNYSPTRASEIAKARAERLRKKHKPTQKVNRIGETGYKGVAKVRDKFRTRIYVAGIAYSLGTYKTAIEAAEAYDAGARRMLGDDTILNFN